MNIEFKEKDIKLYNELFNFCNLMYFTDPKENKISNYVESYINEILTALVWNQGCKGINITNEYNGSDIIYCHTFDNIKKYYQMFKKIICQEKFNFYDRILLENILLKLRMDLNNYLKNERNNKNEL